MVASVVWCFNTHTPTHSSARTSSRNTQDGPRLPCSSGASCSFVLPCLPPPPLRTPPFTPSLFLVVPRGKMTISISNKYRQQQQQQRQTAGGVSHTHTKGEWASRRPPPPSSAPVVAAAAGGVREEQCREAAAATGLQVRLWSARPLCSRCRPPSGAAALGSALASR